MVLANAAGVEIFFKVNRSTEISSKNSGVVKIQLCGRKARLLRVNTAVDYAHLVLPL